MQGVIMKLTMVLLRLLGQHHLRGLGVDGVRNIDDECEIYVHFFPTYTQQPFAFDRLGL